MVVMNTSSDVRGRVAEHSSRFLPFMLVLFVGSGCAALIYEIVWFQVLQLVIGSSAVSLAVLLGTFMGGMCAGSLLLAKYVSPVRHPLDVYARLEGLIGVCGAALIVLMPLVSRLYTAVDGGGQASVVLRAIVCVTAAAPAHSPDGGHAPGDVALRAGHAARRVVAGVLLWRQHRGRGGGLRDRRILPAAQIRSEHGSARRCGDQPDRGCARIRVVEARTVHRRQVPTPRA